MIANINIIQTNLLDQYISICIYISNLRLSIEESFDYMNTSPAIQVQNAPQILANIVKTHNMNQKKQLKAQAANRQYIHQFQIKKKQYQTFIKRDEEIREDRINHERDRIIEMLKKRNEKAEKILEKKKQFQQNSLQQREKRAIKMNHSSKKNTHTEGPRLESYSYLSQQHDEFVRTFHRSVQTLEKSEEKQKRAQQKRKVNIQGMHTFYSTTNRKKQMARLKVAEQQKENTKYFIEKSIKKWEKLQERRQELQQKKNKQLKHKEKLSAQKREAIQKRIEDKLAADQNKYKPIYRDKIPQNNASCDQTIHKSSREEKTIRNRQKYQQIMKQYYERLERSQRKSSQKKAFLTSVNWIKETLIQKNIYENHQIGLRK